MVRVSNPGRSKRFSLLQNVKTVSRAYTVSSSTGTGVVSQGKRGRGLKLTNHLHMESRLRMKNAEILLHLYTFMGWKGKIAL
jgi:hypothetical protein